MKLKEFTVREFKSVWDSGLIKVDDQITCLVGKNESGKTALLTALYRTKPIIQSDAKFDVTYDYPKREVEDYRFDLESKLREKAVVVDCLWELQDDDKAVVTDVFGSQVLEEDFFHRETFYGTDESCFMLFVDDQAARTHLANNQYFDKHLQDDLKTQHNWEDFAAALKNYEAEGETKEVVRECNDLVDAVISDGFEEYIMGELILPRMPQFLYFDEYYQMEGCTNLDALIMRKETEQLDPSDQPLIGLINLARLDLHELVNIKNTTELKNKLENAGNHLTRRIISYWSQNQHIQIKFDVRNAKSEDPEGMREGTNIWGEINDTVHYAHTPLDSRSRGFVWFFSFLAWYEDIKRRRENVILLLDEPGLSLHGRAQADLLAYFEKELSDHQLIYSTHSPFMIDPQHFDRIRIVQDQGIDTKDPLPKEQDGTKVLTDIFSATDDSLFPLQGALGYELHQTLFIGPNTLIVEGPSDLLYLTTVSSQLEREGRTGLSEKWTITPVGGSSKVPTFVALLHSQRGMKIATLLDVKAGDKAMVEGLYKKRLLKKNRVMTYADFLPGKEEADIEDLFDREFYVELVNKEFASQLNSPIQITSLNKNLPRTLRAVEVFLACNKMKQGKFSHYRPAKYFVENIGELWDHVSDSTKDTFESIFDKANSLLG